MSEVGCTGLLLTNAIWLDADILKRKERRRLCVFLLAVVRCPSQARLPGNMAPGSVIPWRPTLGKKKKKRLTWSKSRRRKLELPLSMIDFRSVQINIIWRWLWFGFFFRTFKIAHFFLIAPLIDGEENRDLLAHCHPHSCEGSQLPSCSSENIPPSLPPSLVRSLPPFFPPSILAITNQ